MNFLLSCVLWVSLSTIALGTDIQDLPQGVSAAADQAGEMVGPPAQLDALLVKEVPVAKTFLQQMTDGTFLAQLAAFFVLLSVFLRTLSELLLWFSKLTHNKGVGKAADFVAKASWYVGVLIGKMGWGTAKAVVAEKAKETGGDGPKAA